MLSLRSTGGASELLLHVIILSVFAVVFYVRFSDFRQCQKLTEFSADRPYDLPSHISPTRKISRAGPCQNHRLVLRVPCMERR